MVRKAGLPPLLISLLNSFRFNLSPFSSNLLPSWISFALPVVERLVAVSR